MIIDTPAVSNLAAGADRATPEAGDGVLTVPPILVPSVEPITTLNIGTGTPPQTANSSFAISNLIAKAAATAAAQILVLSLPKGYYRVNYNLAMVTIGAFTVNVGAMASLRLVYQGSGGIPVVSLMSGGAAGVSASSRT